MSSAPGAPSPQPPAAAGSVGGKWTYVLLALALLFVLMPFLFWNATWFGRPLSDTQITRSLAEHSHPRAIQHALSLVEARIEKNDPTARQWYPQIVKLAGDRVDEIRLTAAWVMGQDTSAPEFHQTLLRLLNDPQPMVQRNAALALVRFGDDSGHALIVSMLCPYDLAAPAAGVLSYRLKPGDVVNPGTLVGTIRAGNEKREVRTIVPGTLESWLVPDGSGVAPGQAVVRLDPSAQMAWEALRALYFIGRREDLPAIQPYAQGARGMPAGVAQQANLTARAIQSRAGFR